MDLLEALEEHLESIRSKDFERFAATVAQEEMLLVTADGEVIDDGRQFLDLHRSWFASPEWSVDARLVHAREFGGVATCVLRLMYRPTGDVAAPAEESILSLVFVERGGRWLLVQDQNTPVRL
jgi:uncharacterized protein (TIGR02246 family)